MRHIGIDLALSAPHKAAVFEDGRTRGKPFRVPQSRAGWDRLLERATKDHEGPCEFVMEPTGLAWIPLSAELQRHGHRVYVPKGQKVSALRKFYAEHAKTDNIDARATGMIRHVDQDGTFEVERIESCRTMLRMTIKHRSRLVLEAARAKDRIHSWLVLANPSLGRALGREPCSAVGRAFLRSHLDPESVVAMGRDGLAEFWSQQSHGPANARQCKAVWRSCEATTELYAGLRQEHGLPFDYPMLQRMVRMELDHMEVLERQVGELDQEISRLYGETDPDRILEREVPGLGPTIAPTVEAFVGNVGRFPKIKAFAKYVGLVPRTKQTGGGPGKPRQKLTKGGPDLLKQYFFLAAESARRADPELAATYDKKLREGKHHYAAVIAVAHKLARKTYALLKLRDAARRSGTEPSDVKWRYTLPGTGQVVSKSEARAWVATHFPSKAQKQLAEKKQKAAAGARKKGSPESDATSELTSEPPRPEVSDSPRCEKPVGRGEENPMLLADIIRRLGLQHPLDRA
jgi:transposase